MTQLVSIVNITPDSFSDGGKYIKPDVAISAIAEHIEQGADIIDIGAESTRPDATPLTQEQEWQRLEPVLSALPHFLDESVQFSLDTRHPETAQKALAYGVHIINDVSGFENPAMVDAVKASACKLVVMHSLSVPADKNIVLSKLEDPVEALLTFARKRLAGLEEAGITRDRLIFDPGIGFGKTAQQSLEILRRITEFNVLGMPLFIGHSRKSFLSSLPIRARARVGARDGLVGARLSISTSQAPLPTSPLKGEGNNDDATLVVSQYLAEKRIDYLRVHEVARHRHMLDIMEGLHG